MEQSLFREKPPSVITSTCTVGFPLESNTSNALTLTIFKQSFIFLPPNHILVIISKKMKDILFHDFFCFSYSILKEVFYEKNFMF